MFLRQAIHLRDGEWLGPYDLLTLAKGMFYPLFVAVGYEFHIPLVTWQHMFYLASCAVLVVAVAGIYQKPWQKAVLFAVLAVNPAVLIDLTVTFRERIYSSLTLLVLACLVGVYARRRASVAALLGWSAGLGLALSAFWLTREEGAWMLPACAACAAYVAWDVARWKPADRLARWGACAAPFALLALSVGAISAMNFRHYGVFMTNELKSGEFRAAYGSLLRVKHEKELRYVAVPRETRERIYAVSPSFARLRPWLEGENAKYWGKYSMYAIGREAYENGEIGVGHFMWAFRSAVDKIGCCRSARQAQEFYRTLAEEVNGACERGQLECGPRRDSLAPPWPSGGALPLAGTFLKGVTDGVSLQWESVRLVTEGVSLPWERVINPYSSSPLGRQPGVYRQITSMESAPGKEDAAAWESEHPEAASVLRGKTAIIHGMITAYAWVVPPAAVMAAAWNVFMLWRAVRGKKVSAVFWICSILFLAYVCRIALLAYVDFMVTAVALDFRRLSATYGLVLAYSTVGLLDMYAAVAPGALRALKAGVLRGRTGPNGKGDASCR